MNDDNKKDVRKNLFGSPFADVPPVPTSPVLVRNVRPYKKRRNSGSSSWEQSVPTPTRSPVLGENSYCKERKRVKRTRDLNMNSMGIRDTVVTEYLKSKRKIACTIDPRLSFERVRKHLQNDFERALGTDSTTRECRAGGSNGRKGDEKNTENIEIESNSSEDNDVDDAREIHINNSDTDTGASDGIEIEATQNVIVDKDCDRSPVLSASSSSRDQTPPRECSDETFFSEAERSPSDSTSVKLSQEISQDSSPVKNMVERKLSEIALTINTETSPRRTPPDASMQLTLLDSGKKRKKPKRGSLVEKLHSMINNQRSSVRLWRYQLRRTMETGTPTASVTVFVRKCVGHLGRQFLEGNVVEDSHGLLSCDKRLLWIMVVPETTGKIEMKSVGLVQIFPPWEVLDDEEPVLNVAFIRVVPNEEADAERYENMTVGSRKRTVVEEFDCPCIGANRMIASCKDRFSRPNIIRRLFNHDMR